MRKASFTIGFNDAIEKRQILTDERIMEIIVSVVAEQYEGATFIPVHGLYCKAFEKSLRVEVYGAEESRDFLIMDELRKALNQKSIAYEVAEVNSMLYGEN